MIISLNTENTPCLLNLTIEAKSPIILRMIGFNPRKENTKYFNRTYSGPEGSNRFVGTKKFCFPLPITPQLLHVEVTAKGILNEQKVKDIIKIKSVEMNPLRQLLPRVIIPSAPAPVDTGSHLWLRKDEYEFFKFAREFSVKAGWSGDGAYLSDDNKFRILYVDEIRNTETGAIESTPARISRKNGVIEINRTKFLEMTIPMRIMILLHEFVHWRLNTRVELECDFNAINVFLKYGFPKSEAMYAFTKLFVGSERLAPRTAEIVKFIEDFPELNCGK